LNNEEESKCPHDNVVLEDYYYICLDCNEKISKKQYDTIKNRRELENLNI